MSSKNGLPENLTRPQGSCIAVLICKDYAAPKGLLGDCKSYSCAMLQSVCSDAGSFDITAPFLGGCIEEANEAYVVAVKRQESGAHAQVSIKVLLSAIPLSLPCKSYARSNAEIAS